MIEHDPMVQHYRAFLGLFDWSRVPQRDQERTPERKSLQQGPSCVLFRVHFKQDTVVTKVKRVAFVFEG